MIRHATPRSGSDEALADALHSASIHLLRGLRKADVLSGVSPARLSALSVVVFAGPLRISDLARAEQVKTPTITPIVAALERDGLVVREKDENDGRAAVLRATARGEKLMAEGRARRVARLTAALRELTPSERRTLRAAAALMHQLAKRIP